MTAGLILFTIASIVSVLAALGMLFSKNAVHSALFLIVNFSAIAFFYLLLNAPFLAMVQITIYAGAIMVLFLFVVMLLGGERVPITNKLRWQIPLSVLLVLALLATATYTVISGEVNAMPGDLGAAAENFGGPANLGEVLFSNFLFPFELTSVLLLVAMVGAIVLTKDEDSSQKSDKAASKK